MNKFWHGLLTLLIGFVLSAFTLSCIWEWFIHPLAPEVLVPTIPLPLALGLSLFLVWGNKGLLIDKAYSKKDEPYDYKRSWYGLLGTLTFLGMAWFYHWLSQVNI